MRWISFALFKTLSNSGQPFLHIRDLNITARLSKHYPEHLVHDAVLPALKRLMYEDGMHASM